MHTKFFALLYCCIWIFSSAAWAGIIHVPAQEPTIQAGIDGASAGDVVLIADGVYSGPGNRDLDFNGKAVTVRSENGPLNCVIDCQGLGRGAYFHNSETRNSVLSGVTITNGRADYGGGIRSNASPTIVNCRIIGNRADESGGGIFCSLRTCRIENCLITGNTAATGGALHLSHAAAEVVNCTVCRNSAFLVGGIYAIFETQHMPTILNSILWDNVTDVGSDNQLFPGVNSFVSYSAIDQDGFDEDDRHNIRQNPIFANPDQGDYSLGPASPCIDNGLILTRHTTDVNGFYRVVDGDGDGFAIVDMGAYEHGSFPIIPGDLDSSFHVDLADAVLVFQVLTGIHPDNAFNTAADPAALSRIDLQDAVYILQAILQLRQGTS